MPRFIRSPAERNPAWTGPKRPSGVAAGVPSLPTGALADVRGDGTLERSAEERSTPTGAVGVRLSIGQTARGRRPDRRPRRIDDATS